MSNSYDENHSQQGTCHGALHHGLAPVPMPVGISALSGFNERIERELRILLATRYVRAWAANGKSRSIRSLYAIMPTGHYYLEAFMGDRGEFVPRFGERGAEPLVTAWALAW